jgi:hypothetical protein
MRTIKDPEILKAVERYKSMFALQRKHDARSRRAKEKKDQSLAEVREALGSDTAFKLPDGQTVMLVKKSRHVPANVARDDEWFVLEVQHAEQV